MEEVDTTRELEVTSDASWIFYKVHSFWSMGIKEVYLFK